MEIDLPSNHRPIKEFENYSPSEMHNMLYNSFQDGSVVRLKDNIPEHVLDKIPILTVFRYFLLLIKEAGKIKLTIAGYIPPAIVKLVHQQPLAARINSMGLSESIPTREVDSIILLLFRNICKINKLTRISKNVLSLTKRGNELLKDKHQLLQEIIRLYAAGTAYSFQGFNQGAEIALFGIEFHLILLNKYSDEGNPVSFYIAKMFEAFPNLAKDIPEDDIFNNTVEVYTLNYQIHVLHRFYDAFGFIEERNNFSWIMQDKLKLSKSVIFNDIIEITPPSAPADAVPGKIKVSTQAIRRNTEFQLKELTDILKSRTWESLEEMQEFISNNQFDTPEKVSTEPSNEDKSMKLYIEAMDAPPLEARKMIREALELDPRNVEALMNKAYWEKNIAHRIKKLKEIVIIAKKNLGSDFEQLKGNFWIAHETRPYMRVMQSLAECYTELRSYNDAIAIINQMLLLNPNDNQGMRYQQGALLVATNRYEEYLELRKQFNDGSSASWNYVWAIYLYKTTGKSIQTQTALIKAINQNNIVPKLISGEIPMPDYLPDHYRPGDGNEAIICVEELMPILITSPGVMELFKRK